MIHPKVVKYVIDSIGSLSFIVLILLFSLLMMRRIGYMMVVSFNIHINVIYYCQCRSSIYMDSENIFKSSVSIYREKVLQSIFMAFCSN